MYQRKTLSRSNCFWHFLTTLIYIYWKIYQEIGRAKLQGMVWLCSSTRAVGTGGCKCPSSPLFAPTHIRFLRNRMFSSCVMHKKNYVHLILQIPSKANDVIEIAWTLSGFNFSSIGSLWRPLEAVLQPRHSDRVASPAKPRPLEAFKGQRWLKNWNHLNFRLFWSQY